MYFLREVLSYKEVSKAIVLMGQHVLIFHIIFSVTLFIYRKVQNLLSLIIWNDLTRYLYILSILPVHFKHLVLMLFWFYIKFPLLWFLYGVWLLDHVRSDNKRSRRDFKIGIQGVRNVTLGTTEHAALRWKSGIFFF